MIAYYVDTHNIHTYVQYTFSDSLEIQKAKFFQAWKTLEVEYDGALEPECEFSSNNEVVVITNSTCLSSANNTLKLHFTQVKEEWKITEARIQFKFSWSTGNTCPVYTVLYDYETSKCHEMAIPVITHIIFAYALLWYLTGHNMAHTVMYIYTGVVVMVVSNCIDNCRNVVAMVIDCLSGICNGDGNWTVIILR